MSKKNRRLELIKQLRRETGWGLMACKKALNNSNWEIDAAKTWLVKHRKKSGIIFN